MTTWVKVENGWVDADQSTTPTVLAEAKRQAEQYRLASDAYGNTAVVADEPEPEDRGLGWEPDPDGGALPEDPEGE